MEIALGVLLGVLGVAVAALTAFLVVRRARPGRPADPAVPEPVADDLPGFLEAPPGTSAAASSPRAGWAALSPQPAVGPADDRPRRPDRPVALGALAAVGVLLIALAVAVLTGRDDSRPHRSEADDAPRDRAPTSAARLAFGGLVLERHAVGVTATYPSLEVAPDGEEAVNRLELPTFHCLTDEAPEDPDAAGCRRSVTEYADLSGSGLSFDEDGGLRIAGRFPTYLLPNGTAPEPTGRTYELTITAEPQSTGPDGEWVPATGVLLLGADRTTADPDRSRMRRES